MGDFTGFSFGNWHSSENDSVTVLRVSDGDRYTEELHPEIKDRTAEVPGLDGEYYFPATNALWFYAPSKGASCKSTWYDQKLAGRYKNHCFYNPEPGVCSSLY